MNFQSPHYKHALANNIGNGTEIGPVAVSAPGPVGGPFISLSLPQGRPHRLEIAFAAT